MRMVQQRQREMSARRQVALQRGAVAALDVGSSKIACLLLRLGEQPRDRNSNVVSINRTGPGIRVVGSSVQQSRGVRNGEIHNVGQAEFAIRAAISTAQKSARTLVDNVLVCFSGGRPRSAISTGSVPLGNHRIDEDDVARVLDACDLPPADPDREFQHAQPIEFRIDHRTDFSDPRGQYGNRLEVELHAMDIDKSAIDNLEDITRSCQLELAGTVSAAYASAKSTLVEDEQDLGAACIDMGAGSTGISIFSRGHMVHATTIPLGGSTITSDICAAFSLPFSEAERIKTMTGGAIASYRDDFEYCNLGGDSLDENAGGRAPTRTELIGVMRPRIEEMLELVRAKLYQAHFHDLQGDRIVLTGGCSVIPLMDELAREILGSGVRLGRPIRVRNLPQVMAEPQFSAVVGLCLHAEQPEDELWDFHVPVERAGKSTLRSALSWLKGNW